MGPSYELQSNAPTEANAGDAVRSRAAGIARPINRERLNICRIRREKPFLTVTKTPKKTMD